MDHTFAVILAFDGYNGMKSTEPVFTYNICGATLMEWVCKAVRSAGIDECVTADGISLLQTVSGLGSKKFALLLYGDMPMIRADAIENVVKYLATSGSNAIAVTLDEKEGSEEQPLILCLYTDLLIDVLKDIGAGLSELTPLSDILKVFLEKGHRVDRIKAADPGELFRVQDKVGLASAAGILRKRINEGHMRSGVTMLDPSSVYIDTGVEIGTGTVIYPGTILEGATKIGEGCVIGPNSRIVDSRIGNNAEIQNSVIFESSIGDYTHVGPFAYIRPGSNIGEQVKIGDFVEIKNSDIGDKTKISHLTYVGDAEIGKNVNLGCGVVVVNYDGVKKHRTIVEENAFVGCNVNLVAPVTVRRNAFIAAGSTITEEVPEDSLAIARSRQVVKEGWVIKKGIQR